MESTRNKEGRKRKVGHQRSGRDPAQPHAAIVWTRRQTAIAALMVGLVAGCLYLPILGHPFISFDDPAYVSENAHVKEGLSWNAFTWAWTSLEDGNWHPVTWISHEADAQIFGMAAAGHHFMSLLFHSANAALLFLFLATATRCASRSLAVALLFAVHPLNVESVAWVAERKNLLSAFWSLLCLLAYVRYSRSSDRRCLAGTIGLLMLALASKPMSITLPFIMLLLDRWPLGRVNTWQELFKIVKLWAEKIPLFALCVASAIVTIIAQHRSGAIASLTQVPMPWRLENAVLSYVVYGWKLIWPFGLAFLYPWPQHTPPTWEVAGATLFVIVATVVAWKQYGHRRWLTAGWLWFLGTLIPVIGIVQVGSQSRADRYCYIPMIGLLIAMVWFGAEILQRAPARFKLQPIMVIAIAIFFAIVSRHQMEYWRSNYDLWLHTWQVTTDNYLAADKVGVALQSEGRHQEALPYFERALQINPADPLANFNVGADLHSRGRLQDALSFYRITASQDTDPQLRADALENMGAAYHQIGNLDAARERYLEALQHDPGRTRIYAELRQIETAVKSR
jgi:protein O-mannosyl-transferase